jgi:hypothetical protein
MKEMDFEEMRNQFAILKEELNKQEIVNNRLLRETMKAKVNVMSSVKRFTYGAGIISIILCSALYFARMWSIAFIIATCVMVVFCMLATVYTYRPVEQLNFIKDDMKTVAKVMVKFKKQSKFWERYVTPALIIPWLSWACYEYAWKYAPKDINPIFYCAPLIIGAVIGGFIGMRKSREATNAAQEIIDEIENN